MSVIVLPQIDAMQMDDWPTVRAIYIAGIATGHATFETNVPAWPEWDAAHHNFARLVARRESEIAGWAALSPVSKRQVYAGVAEVSVYVAEAYRGCGVGKALLHELIHRSEERGIWTLQASIFPENLASMSVHRTCGFRVVGRRERLAKQYGKWRDVMLLERRGRFE